MKTHKYETPNCDSSILEVEGIIALSDILGLPGLPFDVDNTHNYDEPF